MNILAVCAAMAVCGADVGWQPFADGGTEYVIRIGPDAFDRIMQGEEPYSDVPVEAGTVWRIRITGPAGDIPTNDPPSKWWTSRLAPVPSGRTMVPPPDDIDVAPPAVSISASTPPRELPPLPVASPMVRPATWDEEGNPAAKQPRDDEILKPAEPEKPWSALMLAVVVAVGSTSGMCYFGWVALEYRSRYRKLLAEMLQSGDPAAMLERAGASAGTD